MDVAAATAPKQWSLTKQETVASVENWKQNFLFRLQANVAFKPFLEPNAQWGKKSKASPLRGFADDGEDVPTANRRTAVQKTATLDLMLGHIASYCTVIARNTIVNNSTSLESVWQSIRAHYGFHTTGARFLDMAKMELLDGERPEDLFQRLTAFIDDNLLRASGPVKHMGNTCHEDEEVSPTVENMVVYWWLFLIHRDLPALVKQKYATVLRSQTLASIKPEISMALDTLLAELQSQEEAIVLRSRFPSNQSQWTQHRQSPGRRAVPAPDTKVCPLCKQAGRPNFAHFLSRCPFLPESDRRFIAKARSISATSTDETAHTREYMEDPQHTTDDADIQD